LRDTAPFSRVINKAHHRLHEITPVDAREVNAAFKEIDQLLRSCTASYARFMGRLTRDDTEFYLLGSTALSGQIVVVSLDREARDGDPVIALYEDKVYARRIARDQRDPSRITLIADRSGTERVPPVLILPRAKTRLLPIVGVLYEQVVVPGAEEACLVDNSPIWERGLSAARIVDDSAYPTIRDGDLVLLERMEDVTTGALERLEDRIVAVVVSGGGESFGFLKRMGSALDTSFRILEKIGLIGSSVCVRVGAGEEGQISGTLSLDRLWRVHGVIRSEILSS
jgi:SOS-response transcriptional repressor LexA